MLKVLRDNLKRLKWLLLLPAGALILFLFVTDDTGMSGTTPQSVAATVGGTEITFAEFEREYREVERYFQSIYGDSYTADLAEQLQLPFQAMERLVNAKIQLQEAERLGIQATTAEIQDAILAVPAFKDANGGFIGVEEYRRVIQSNRMTVDSFENDLRDSIMVQKFNTALAQANYVADEEVERTARREAERASIRFFELTSDAVGADLVLTDEEIDAYFAENADNYRLPEQRTVGSLVVSINTIRAAIEVDDAAAEAYYNANPDEFTQEEQVRARHILLWADGDRTPAQAQSDLEAAKARIAAGEEFAAVAEELSDDVASKAQGGDLGFFGRGRMTKPFEDAAFAAEIETLVGPFENDIGGRKGYHLLEVTARREGGLQALDDVSNRIRVRLQNDQAREQAQAVAEALHARVGERGAGDEAAAQQIADEEGVTFEVKGPFGGDDSIPGIGRATPFSSAAFGLADGEWSQPVRIPAGWAILTLLDVAEPRLPELAEVVDEVRADATAQRRASLALERLEELKDSIASGRSTFSDGASELGATVQDSAPFGEGGTVAGLQSPREVIAAALSLEEGDVGGPIATDNGAVLFEVATREKFDPVAFEESKDDTRSRLITEKANGLLMSIIESRKQELGVSYKQQFLDNFGLNDQDSGAS